MRVWLADMYEGEGLINFQAYAGRGVAGYAVNNGSALTVAGRIYVAAASNTMYAYTDMGTGAWTNSGAKRLDFCLTYGI